MRAWCSAVLLLCAGCSAPDMERDDVDRYLFEPEYRRSILEDDLVTTDNAYAQSRLANYSHVTSGWDVLSPRDEPTAPLTVQLAQRLADGEPLEFDDDLATTLVPDELPETPEGWRSLGRRVMLEYPMYVDPDVELAAASGWLDELGFLEVDGVYNGIRVVLEDGEPRLGLTCSACHMSTAASGALDPILANRGFDVGRLRLARLLEADGSVPALEEYGPKAERFGALGPGRSDPLNDDTHNPYAYPDLGGIADMPYLHHTANWHNRGVATLAVRVETVFVADEVDGTRVPRELSWALAEYLYSLPPPPPMSDGSGPLVARGQEVFDEQSCSGCHVPPLYTSDRLVSLEEVGTDPAAGESPARATGYYRIPSLRGVGRTAPYLHHGAFDSLEDMFDPQREEPGHPFGLGASAEDRAALIEFLRSI